MLDEAAIYRALRDVIDPDDRVIVLHSALYPLKVPGDALKWPILAALRRLLDDGHTLAVPTFSFAFCRDGAYHHRETRSEAGVLGDWFLTLRGVRRSPHPIYAFAVAGPAAETVLACTSTTTFGQDSPFGLFEREDARLVMLGCGWQSCTQLHHYEEAARAPYRVYKDFTGTADLGGGPRKTQARMFVRDRGIDAVNDFTMIRQSLLDQSVLREARLGEAVIEATTCRDLSTICRTLLAEDPYSFVHDAPRVRDRTEAMARRVETEPLRIALLGQANLDLLNKALANALQGLIPDRKIEVYSPPFGQAYREAMDPKSALAEFQPQFVVLADRLEDLAGVDSLDELRGEGFDALTTYLAVVRACAETLGATVFVNDFANVQIPALGAADAAADDGTRALVAAANARLADEISNLPTAHVFDLDAALRRFNGAAHDARLWHLGRIPFSQAFTEELARRFAGLILAATGRGARLLVLDLDNTLWGGVLGEDGLEALQLGGDYPGNAYRHFQKTLKQLSERGIALAIASKNDEAEARAAIATLPGMVLKEADLAALRINWQDKPQNLLEIAAETGLGLESIAFVDDNPAERARMRHMLPTVKVIDLPDDPALYAETLLRSPYLECLSLTAEDRKRSKRYAGRRAMASEQRRFARVEDFYAHLQSKVRIASLEATNLARAEQLCAKTNQFNTTTQRYSSADLQALARNGAGVYVIGLEDRYSEAENIGLLVVHWDRPRPRSAEIDLLLLSCRVLGRGVETAVLGWLAGEAKRRGVRVINGEIRESPRNEPVRDLYREHGFITGRGNGLWTLDLAASQLAVPDWIAVSEQLREAALA